uniref:RING-type domain-containing protein n=1 Tax=Meloidogyne incognita TaxID=6306 RepID=A0A914LWU6_MELIC
MKEFMFNNAVKNGSTACSICLEEFQEDKVIVKTKCNHYFHRDCISKNFKEGSANFKKCPICRATLELDDNEDVVKLNNKLKIVDLGFEGKNIFRLFY